MALTHADRTAVEMGMTHHVAVEGGIGTYVNGMDAVVKAISSYGGRAPVVITPVADIVRFVDKIRSI